MAKFGGKTALVTGASSGLGFHFAKLLTRAGAQVILAARCQDALLERADMINSDGGQVSTLRLDVTDPKSIHSLEASLSTVDIVNNAGVVNNGSALDQTKSELGFSDRHEPQGRVSHRSGGRKGNASK